MPRHPSVRSRSGAQKKLTSFTQQHPQQRRSGRQKLLQPVSEAGARGYVGCGLLRDKVAIITGGDSGIGRAVAAAFAKEGADIAFDFLSENDDAEQTVELVRSVGRRCLALPCVVTSLIQLIRRS